VKEPSSAPIAVFIVGVMLVVSAQADQAPPLKEILLKAGAYVSDFHRQLSGIVADEQYSQEWKTRVRQSHAEKTVERRLLASDLVLVKPSGAAAWMEFRDVYAVDGAAVRDRQDRLTTLFLQPSASSAAQIGRILDASARYNIGDIERNVNTPVFALLFLELANQGHFKFALAKDRTPQNSVGDELGRGAFRVSTEVWVVAYEERKNGTMIRTTAGRDLPAHGRFWIDPAGRVLMSELVVENRQLNATIDVSYQSEPMLGLLVPIEMREHYEGLRTSSIIEGRASYGKFRQFQVSTDETFLVKK
jgi:hypothetical protein